MTRQRTTHRYLAICFTITWPAWWVLALLGGVESGPAPLLIVGGAGPLIAALAVRTPQERRELVARVVDLRRLTPRAWVVVAAVGVVPAGLAALTAVVVGDPETTTVVGAVGALGFGLLAGVGEEPGWRGTLLDPLVERHGRLAASAMVGVVWAVWHLPLYLADGTYQHGRGLGWFAVSLVELPALSILLAWAYLCSCRLVAAPVLAHALGNAAGEVLPGGGVGADAVQTAVIILGGMAVGMAWTRSDDARNESATGQSKQ